MRTLHRRILAGSFLLGLLPPAAATAQSNVIPGTDAKLGALGSISALAHQGTFPNGLSSAAMSTTVCNDGTVQVPWLKAMNPNHPFIAFLVVRESNGRMVQISDRSYLKHAFFALSNSQCTPCQGGSPNGTFLGIGCSDTYSVTNNGDNYWLGPPEEIDPWLGTWTPQCSHFDRGEPAVAPPADCDGVRSLTASQASALGPIGHRIRIQDAELDVAGAKFFYQGQYVVRGEAGPLRDDNLGSRAMQATWNGTNWSFSSSGALQLGSVLQRWSGASLSSAGNGSDDGRLNVAVQVASLGGAGHHYEYAVHNQDNFRGVGAVRIPLSPGAQVSNAGFRDIDAGAGNDWSIAQIGNELVFSTAANPLEWNTIYNFWFDCDAAPFSGGAVQLDQFLAGTGAPTVAVASTTPEGGFCPPAATYCTASPTSISGCFATLSGSGTPSMANPLSFTVSASAVPGGNIGIMYFSDNGQASIPFGTLGGFLCAAPPVSRSGAKSGGGTSGACNGAASFTLQDFIIGDPLIVVAGATINAGFWFRDPPNTPDGFGLSNGIQFDVCQ